MVEIEHFFAPVSGYAYLGHRALLRLAAEYGVRVKQRPVDIVHVFAAGGSTPPAKQSDARRAWRTRDMRLWANHRGLPLKDKPKHWPTDGALAARAIVALDAIGGPVDALVSAVLGAVWARDLDIADPTVIAGLLRSVGANADATLSQTTSAATQNALDSNTADAIGAGAFGSPTYRIGAEIFFGQDRLDFVQAALATSRVA